MLLYHALLQADAAASLMQPHSICCPHLTVKIVMQSIQAAYHSCWHEANQGFCKLYQCMEPSCWYHVFKQECAQCLFMTLEQQLCPKPERCQCNAKVLHQGSQVSTCAVVRGTQRNLFVVPTAGTFEDKDLKSLEEEAGADPSMKGQLMKKLHVS